MSVRWEFDETTPIASPCDVAIINGHTVRVSLFDEAVLAGTHCYHWEIASDHPDVERHPAGRILHGAWLNGWEASVAKAKRAAVTAAREMEPA